MIAIQIGKILLKEFNKRNKKKYSAEEFFLKEFWPLFYDNEKYLQSITNSKFFQIGSNKNPKKEKRKEMLKNLQNDLNKQIFHMGTAPGFMASDSTQATFSQLTSLKFPIFQEDVYLAWIGNGCGIGIAGGLTIYFQIPDLLYSLYLGWKEYRKLLNNNKALRPNQIDGWNSIWIHSLIFKRRINLNDKLYFDVDPKTKILGIERIKWLLILWAINKQYHNLKTINGYVFNFSQQNTTIGFINFNLYEIKYPMKLYQKLFGKNEYLKDEDKILNLFGTAHGFKTFCKMGVIGITALEPKGLAEFYSENYKQSKKIENGFQPNTFKTYILAMINNTELNKKTEELIQIFKDYEATETKGKVGKSKLIEEILTSSSLPTLLNNFAEFANKYDKGNKILQAIKLDILDLNKEKFKMFMSLLRINYNLK